MVLSNKKLKQRIRSLLAESVAAAESRDAAGAEDAKQQLQGVKELLSSKSHRGDRPAGSGGKRKRKNKSSAEGPEAAEAGQEHQEEAGDVGGSVDSNNNNNNNNNKKKKKRKREEGGGAGEGAAESNDQTHQKKKREEEEEGEKMKKKKKKAKKKKRKKKKEGEGNEEVVKKNGNEAGGSSGGGNEMKATDAAAIDTSLENSDAMKKVYVGGIPYYSTEDDIRSFFESCGTITEVDCMAFPESGKFRGIAILTFKTEAAAKRAFALDGADMGGLYLKIQPYKAARTQKADFSPEVIDGYYRIYVGNLPWDITEDALRKLFLNRNISSIRFGEDKVTGEFKGYAHVDFEDGQSRAAALKLDQTVVCGRPVRIRCAVPKKGVETKQTPKPLASHGSSDGGRHASSVSAKGKSDTDGNASSGGAKKKKKRQTCYVCGVPGHLSSSCPQKKADGPASGSS